MSQTIRILPLLAAGLAMLGALPAHAQGDPQAGQSKATTCIACHGPDGNSFNPLWPKLAGQHANFLVAQLKAFKSGARNNPLMTPMVAPLSEQDMLDLAAFFSAQTLKPGEGKAEQLEAGSRLYRGGNIATGVVACAGCHGPSGSGNPAAGFPRIGGQHADYIAQALRDYRGGTRDNDINGMMRGVAKNLTDDEIVAVAQYLTGLQ